MTKTLTAILLAAAAAAAPMAGASATDGRGGPASLRAGAKPGIAAGQNLQFAGAKPGIAAGQNLRPV